jgi:hypothetical protein
MPVDAATRYIGNCQICEGDFKVVPAQIKRVEIDGQTVEQPMDGKMVHHGYKRPGHGYIVGDCWGVHNSPYEVSCDLIKAAIPNVKEDIRSMRERIGELERGKDHNGDDLDVIDELEPGSRWRQPKITKHKKSELSEYDWQRVVEQRIWYFKSRIKMAEFTLKNFEERVRAWKPAWIRSIEEERAKKDVARKARATEAAERQKVKDDKRATIDAKNKASEEKKALLVAETIEKLRKLAAGPDPSKQKWRAWEIMSRLHKKVGWKYYQPKEWKIDQDLIALGVARYSGAYVQYDSA